ncbi:copper chaperone CopZ [Effusibacillus lacus]|uniref:Copper chaperone CopZ n=1 Tax=Effusibacillus lacus TaxID=1348429 RepID=A0A292YLD7_9BACL|nr:copper chaperone CopZ [Effusibacillus lacus]TCS69427.1 copper chaperone [Effusibacillus lacus]GAX89194.1 copper resistance protein CopZ [Effusibacillus lacus]
MATVTLNVKGMSCGHCVKAIEGALGELNGVERALVDLQGGTVTVEYREESVSVDQMKEAIEDAGYDVA